MSRLQLLRKPGINQAGIAAIYSIPFRLLAEPIATYQGRVVGNITPIFGHVFSTAEPIAGSVQYAMNNEGNWRVSLRLRFKKNDLENHRILNRLNNEPLLLIAYTNNEQYLVLNPEQDTYCKFTADQNLGNKPGDINESTLTANFNTWIEPSYFTGNHFTPEAYQSQIYLNSSPQFITQNQSGRVLEITSVDEASFAESVGSGAILKSKAGVHLLPLSRLAIFNNNNSVSFSNDTSAVWYYCFTGQNIPNRIANILWLNNSNAMGFRNTTQFSIIIAGVIRLNIQRNTIPPGTFRVIFRKVGTRYTTFINGVQVGQFTITTAFNFSSIGTGSSNNEEFFQNKAIMVQAPNNELTLSRLDYWLKGSSV